MHPRRSESVPKKPYHAPVLVELGSIEAVTQTGFTKPGNDFNFNEKQGFFGSVYPPGHDE